MKGDDKVLNIKSIYIDNFKAFNKFYMEFNSKLNVMIGFNGTGKTTILETISSILTGKLDYFTKDEKFSFVELKVEQENEEKNIKVENCFGTIKVKIDGKEIANIRENIKFQRVIYVPTEVNFTNVKLNGAAKIENEENENIILTSEVMSKQLKQFLVNEKYKDLNDIADGNKENAIRIEKFKNLYNNFFTDKEFIGIDNDTYEPQFRLKDTNKVIKVEDLSAGEKQIFFRGGSILQNISENSLILIDEPEISMHPEWQQKILEFYKNISPNSQYIISTHSPHIATCTLPEEIKVFDKEDGKIIVKDINASYGRTVSELLTSLFELKTLRDEQMERDIKRYKELVFLSSHSSEEKKEMEALKDKITKYIDPNDPDVAMIEFEKGTNELKEKLKKIVGGIDA